MHVTPRVTVHLYQERRLRMEVESLERDTGVKLRVLAQNYPDTPGLAIRDFWGVDADTVVFVADPSIGNIINVNVGENIDLLVPRVCVKYVSTTVGTLPSAELLDTACWQVWHQILLAEQRAGGCHRQCGTSAKCRALLKPLVAQVSAIDTCLREPAGKLKCSKVQEPFDKY